MEEKVEKASVAASTALSYVIDFPIKSHSGGESRFQKKKKRLGDKNFQSPKSPFDRKHIMRFRKGAKEEVVVVEAKASFSVRWPFSKKRPFLTPLLIFLFSKSISLRPPHPLPLLAFR